MMPQLLVFDLDDTLYLERDYVTSGFRAVDRWVSETFRKPRFGDLCYSLFEQGVRGTIFNQALRQCGLQDDSQLVHQLVTHYRNHVPNIRLLPDATEFLSRWGDRRPLGLISDGPLAAQTQKYRALKLEKWIRSPTLTDRWGRSFWKPHVRAFTELQRQHRAKPEECLYVADNPTKDFLACHQLGWHSVRICRPGGIYHDAAPYQSGDAENTIVSLEELWPLFH